MAGLLLPGPRTGPVGGDQRTHLSVERNAHAENPEISVGLGVFLVLIRCVPCRTITAHTRHEEDLP